MRGERAAAPSARVVSFRDSRSRRASVSTMKEIIRSVLDAELTGQAYAVRGVCGCHAIARQRCLTPRSALALAD